MSVRKILLSFLLCTPLSFCIASSHQISHNQIAALQQTLNEWRESNQLPGASLSIILPDQKASINFTSGTTQLNGKTPISPNTLFQIDSITKVYTAVLILQLEAEHKLSISQTLGTWLPQYPQWGQVTILQLLNMTSGIPSFTNDDAFNQVWQKDPTRSWTPAEDLTFVQNKPFLFPPGKGWSYDDSNYILLGMIIEKATGKPYGTVLSERILKPLKLTHTYYVPYEYPPVLLNRMATYYSADNQDVTDTNMSQAGAAGAIIATPQDTALFFHDLFIGKLLPKQQMAEMLTPYSAKTGQVVSLNNQEYAFGLGLSRWFNPTVGHMWEKPGGFVGSFAQVSILDKNQIIIAVTANKWSDAGFMSLPRSFAPKLYQILDAGS